MLCNTRAPAGKAGSKWVTVTCRSHKLKEALLSLEVDDAEGTTVCPSCMRRAYAQAELDRAHAEAKTHFLGRPMKKRFGSTMYHGTVTAWDAAARLYKVTYLDNDWEEFSEEELAPLLIRSRAHDGGPVREDGLIGFC